MASSFNIKFTEQDLIDKANEGTLTTLELATMYAYSCHEEDPWTYSFQELLDETLETLAEGGSHVLAESVENYIADNEDDTNAELNTALAKALHSYKKVKAPDKVPEMPKVVRNEITRILQDKVNEAFTERQHFINKLTAIQDVKFEQDDIDTLEDLQLTLARYTKCLTQFEEFF